MEMDRRMGFLKLNAARVGEKSMEFSSEAQGLIKEYIEKFDKRLTYNKLYIK